VKFQGKNDLVVAGRPGAHLEIVYLDRRPYGQSCCDNEERFLEVCRERLPDRAGLVQRGTYSIGSG